jgi:hypothetical protein
MDVFFLSIYLSLKTTHRYFFLVIYLSERMGFLSDLDEKDFGIEVLLFCEL